MDNISLVVAPFLQLYARIYNVVQDMWVKVKAEISNQIVCKFGTRSKKMYKQETETV